jgi:hypothetical protein
LYFNEKKELVGYLYWFGKYKEKTDFFDRNIFLTFHSKSLIKLAYPLKIYQILYPIHAQVLTLAKEPS